MNHDWINDHKFGENWFPLLKNAFYSEIFHDKKLWMIRGVYQPQFQMREGHFWFPVTIGSFLLSVTNPDFWAEPIFLQSFSFGFCSSSLTIHELFWIGVSGATNTPAHKITTENKQLFAKFFAVQTIKVIIVQTNWFPCYLWAFVSISDFVVWGLRADQSLPGTASPCFM